MSRLRRAAASLGAAAALALPGFAHAVEPDEMLPDPRLEARAEALSRELRCVVCQNQTIDGSNAPLARDMRLLVRERLAAGDTDAQAKAYLVARYGNFVLLKPPFQADTLALWASPVVIVLLAGAGLVFAARSGVADPDSDGEDPDPTPV